MSAPDAAANPAAPLRHRISVRFASTFVGNGFNLVASFLAGLLIARNFGPALYGDLNFLLAAFAAASPLLDMGSSSAFFTFLSRSRRAPNFFRYYALWLSAQAAVFAGAVFLTPSSLSARMWLGEPQYIVALALVASFLSIQIWRAVQQVGESARETVQVQTIWVVLNTSHLILVGIAALLGRLTLAVLLVMIALEYGAAALWFFLNFRWSHVLERIVPEPSRSSIWSEYARYCRPLILTSWAGFLFNFADRWMLQRFSGSVQQGLFSISQQFSAVSLLATTAFINILWKELAQAHHNGDKAASERLFLRSSRTLYFVAASLSCFAIPFTRDILPRLLGPAYTDCWPTFAVLSIFPLYASLGQVLGSYFQATGRTRAYMFFTLLITLISLPAAYFVLAPMTNHIPGLGLGSTGLAVKMVLVQILMNNLQGWYICRSEGWRWPMAYQLLVPALLIAVGFSCDAIISCLIPWQSTTLAFVRFGAGFGLYSSCVAAILFRFPGIAGLDARSLGRWTQNGLDYLRSTLSAQRGTPGH